MNWTKTLKKTATENPTNLPETINSYWFNEGLDENKKTKEQTLLRGAMYKVEDETPKDILFAVKSVENELRR